MRMPRKNARAFKDKRLLGAWLAGWLAVGPALAREPYRIGPGDVLQISIFGESRLSGRFKVGSDGAIGFPLVGALPVAGETAAEVMRKLETALAERIPKGSSAAVEVAEHAPIFVLGEVDKPGPVGFTPGMTVLEAVASAGGHRRLREADRLLLPLIAAEQELADLRLAHFAGQVQRARLVAELEDSPFAAADVPIDALVDGKSMRRVIAAEADLFEKRRALLAGQEAALRAQRDSYDPEIESLDAGIALYGEEVRLLAREAETQEALLKKGLTVESRMTAVRREQAALQRSLLEARSYLARAVQRKLEVQQRLDEVRQVRRRDDAAMLRDLDAAQARIERRIMSAAAALDELRRDGTVPAEERLSATVYVLIRRDADGRRSVSVGETDELRPGDVLRVERRNALRAAASDRGGSD
jgi:polysaccharide export outer membrane protein